MKKIPKINKINTKILEQIVSREGMTDHNSDYGPYLEEIQQELYKRYNKQGIIEERLRDKELRDYDLHVHGRACTRCHKVYPLDTVKDNFYPVANSSHRYRPRCKACHVEATRRRRSGKTSTETEATNQSNDHGIDEIPF